MLILVVSLAAVLLSAMLPHSGPQRWMLPEGVFLALLSGGVTSGLGYVIWYAALGGVLREDR